MTNKRIAMFGHKRIPSREGGVEVVVQELCSRLVKNGYSVTCFNRNRHHISDSKYDSKKVIEYEGIVVKTVPTIDIKGLAAVSSSFFSALLCAFGDYDIIHIHAEGPAFFCMIPKLFGKKVIVTIHGLDWKREKWGKGFGSKFIFSGERKAVKYADKIIVLSRDVQRYFIDSYNRKTVLIPNGVSRPSIINAEIIVEKYGLKKNDYILFLGRLVPEKGVAYLIKAFRLVITDKKLVIAGGSSDSDTFVNDIKKLAKNDERIIFTGFVQGRILEELYSNAYVYCLPSDLEGMPLSLLEAMSYGNCCLTSDIEECTSIIDRYGLTFQRGNISDLRDSLQELCDNYRKVKKYKEIAADYICNKYSWDKMVESTIELYEMEEEN